MPLKNPVSMRIDFILKNIANFLPSWECSVIRGWLILCLCSTSKNNSFRASFSLLYPPQNK